MVAVAGTNGIVKVAVSITAVGGVVAMAFGAWFIFQDAIAEEAGKRQQQFYATELQRDADEVAFSLYQLIHKMDEIEEREDNQRARKSDPTQWKQLERQIDILLVRQGQVLEALEDQLKQ